MYSYSAASYDDPTAAAGSGYYYADGGNPNLPSYYNFHRNSSSSNHSLSLPDQSNTITAQTPFYRPPLPPTSSPSSSGDLLDIYDSTGDLQGMNGPPPPGPSSSQDAAAGRISRYTAEERKEKIERYRSKRNQRNFHKKITYACRKTLADSRPRIRGRFARNGETEREMEAEAEAASYDCYSCGSNSNYDNEWWRQMQAVLGTTEEGEVCGYDEDLLSSFADVFSMNLLS